MCKSARDGGQRCAARAREIVHVRAEQMAQAAAAGGPQAVQAVDAWAEAVAVYASTDEGFDAARVGAAVAAARGDTQRAALLTSAMRKGDRLRAANREAGGQPPETALSTSRYGAVVHPARDWPFAHADPRPAQTVVLQPWTPVHTTQKAVHAEHVQAKTGGGLAVTIMADRDADGNTRRWVLDGHHALAAAREQGLPVTAHVHRSGRGDPVTPPRLGPAQPARPTVRAPEIRPGR